MNDQYCCGPTPVQVVRDLPMCVRTTTTKQWRALLRENPTVQIIQKPVTTVSGYDTEFVKDSCRYFRPDKSKVSGLLYCTGRLFTDDGARVVDITPSYCQVNPRL